MEFTFSYDGLSRVLMLPLGTGPRHSSVTVAHDNVVVRMGWLFRATVPRSSITAVEREYRRRIDRGAHGWRGRWLVNGSGRGLVRISIDPKAAGRTLGFPLRLRELTVSLEDPDGFVAALQ